MHRRMFGRLHAALVASVLTAAAAGVSAQTDSAAEGVRAGVPATAVPVTTAPGNSTPRGGTAAPVAPGLPNEPPSMPPVAPLGPPEVPVRPAPIRSNLLNLSTQATIEVANDVMTVTYSAVKEGTDAQSVQAALRQSLELALAEARKAAKPGQVEVETGNFSLSPRYTPPGWQGRAELVTTGKDQANIAKIAGRIQTMTVTRVVHSLSREAREAAEAEATTQAVAKFRARALEVTKLFGFAEFAIREINVTTSESGGEVPLVRARMNAATAMGEVALPAEGGRGVVTVVVNGGVEMR